MLSGQGSREFSLFYELLVGWEDPELGGGGREFDFPKLQVSTFEACDQGSGPAICPA